MPDVDEDRDEGSKNDKKEKKQEERSVGNKTNHEKKKDDNRSNSDEDDDDDHDHDEDDHDDEVDDDNNKEALDGSCTGSYDGEETEEDEESNASLSQDDDDDNEEAEEEEESNASLSQDDEDDNEKTEEEEESDASLSDGSYQSSEMNSAKEESETNEESTYDEEEEESTYDEEEESSVEEESDKEENYPKSEADKKGKNIKSGSSDILALCKDDETMEQLSKLEKPPWVAQSPNIDTDIPRPTIRQWRTDLYPTIMSIATQSFKRTKTNYGLESICLVRTLCSNYNNKKFTLGSFIEEFIGTWKFKKHEGSRFGFGIKINKSTVIENFLLGIKFSLTAANLQLKEWSNETIVYEIRNADNYMEKAWERLHLVSGFFNVFKYAYIYGLGIESTKKRLPVPYKNLEDSVLDILVNVGVSRAEIIFFAFKMCTIYPSISKLKEDAEKLRRLWEENKDTDTFQLAFRDHVKTKYADLEQQVIVDTVAYKMKRYIFDKEGYLFPIKEQQMSIASLKNREKSAKKRQLSNPGKKWRDYLTEDLQQGAWWDFLCTLFFYEHLRKVEHGKKVALRMGRQLRGNHNNGKKRKNQDVGPEEKKKEGSNVPVVDATGSKDSATMISQDYITATSRESTYVTPLPQETAQEQSAKKETISQMTKETPSTNDKKKPPPLATSPKHQQEHPSTYNQNKRKRLQQTPETIKNNYGRELLECEWERVPPTEWVRSNTRYSLPFDITDYHVASSEDIRTFAMEFMFIYKNWVHRAENHPCHIIGIRDTLQPFRYGFYMNEKPLPQVRYGPPRIHESFGRMELERVYFTDSWKTWRSHSEEMKVFLSHLAGEQCCWKLNTPFPEAVEKGAGLTLIINHLLVYSNCYECADSSRRSLYKYVWAPSKEPAKLLMENDRSLVFLQHVGRVAAALWKVLEREISEDELKDTHKARKIRNLLDIKETKVLFIEVSVYLYILKHGEHDCIGQHPHPEPELVDDDCPVEVAEFYVIFNLTYSKESTTRKGPVITLMFKFDLPKLQDLPDPSEGAGKNNQANVELELTNRNVLVKDYAMINSSKDDPITLSPQLGHPALSNQGPVYNAEQLLGKLLSKYNRDGRFAWDLFGTQCCTCFNAMPYNIYFLNGSLQPRPTFTYTPPDTEGTDDSVLVADKASVNRSIIRVTPDETPEEPMDIDNHQVLTPKETLGKDDPPNLKELEDTMETVATETETTIAHRTTASVLTTKKVLKAFASPTRQKQTARKSTTGCSGKRLSMGMSAPVRGAPKRPESTGMPEAAKEDKRYVPHSRRKYPSMCWSAKYDGENPKFDKSVYRNDYDEEGEPKAEELFARVIQVRYYDRLHWDDGPLTTDLHRSIEEKFQNEMAKADQIAKKYANGLKIEDRWAIVDKYLEKVDKVNFPENTEEDEHVWSIARGYYKNLSPTNGSSHYEEIPQWAFNPKESYKEEFLHLGECFDDRDDPNALTKLDIKRTKEEEDLLMFKMKQVDTGILEELITKYTEDDGARMKKKYLNGKKGAYVNSYSLKTGEQDLRSDGKYDAWYCFEDRRNLEQSVRAPDKKLCKLLITQIKQLIPSIKKSYKFPPAIKEWEGHTGVIVTCGHPTHQAMHVDHADVLGGGIGDSAQTLAFVFHCPLYREGSVIRLDVLSKDAREFLSKDQSNVGNTRKYFEDIPVVTRSIYVHVPFGAVLITDARQFHGGHYGTPGIPRYSGALATFKWSDRSNLVLLKTYEKDPEKPVIPIPTTDCNSINERMLQTNEGPEAETWFPQF